MLVDLCSGKGFLALLFALEFPSTRVVAVDSDTRIRTEHLAPFHSISFVCASIMTDEFASQLEELLLAAVAGAPSAADVAATATAAAADTANDGGRLDPRGREGDSDGNADDTTGPSLPAPQPSSSALCVATGVHLCGQLSPRAVSLFGRIAALDALVLVCARRPRPKRGRVRLPSRPCCCTSGAVLSRQAH